MILLNLPRNRQIKTETGPPVQASPANGTGGSGDENGLPSRPLSRPPSGTALGRLLRYDKTSQLAFFNQCYLLLKAGARGSPVNVSFGQESPGTKQGTTTRISRNWFKMSPLRRQRERQKSERLRQCSHYTGSDLCRHENHTG